MNIGHVISKHRLIEINREGILQAVERTPECKGFIVDKKGTKSEPMELVRSTAEEKGLEIIKL